MFLSEPWYCNHAPTWSPPLTCHSLHSHFQEGALLQCQWCDWPRHCNQAGAASFGVLGQLIWPAEDLATSHAVWAPSPQLEARPGSPGVRCAGHYLRLAPSFPRTFSGLATLVPSRVPSWVKSFWCRPTDIAQLSRSSKPCVSGHRTWIGVPGAPLSSEFKRDMLHWRHHAQTSLARSALQLHPRWMWDTTCILLHAHGEAIRSRAFPSLYGRDRSTLPQLLIHPYAVSHTLRGRVAASTNQSGPPDWCLLRLGHVGYGRLHVFGLAFVVRWTCLNHTETGRPLNGWLPHVHCRGMQGGSRIHLGCNCSGTPCQARLGVVPPVQHVQLEPRLEGPTWCTDPDAVNGCARLGASGWLSFVSWTSPGTLHPAGHSWGDVHGHLREGAGAKRGQPWEVAGTSDCAILGCQRWLSVWAWCLNQHDSLWGPWLVKWAWMTGQVPQMKQPHWDCCGLVNCAARHLTKGSYVGNGRGWDGCINQVMVLFWSIGALPHQD